MNPNLLIIGGNDEHGMSPPTAGKRSPILPYLNRPFYENEFNRAAKQRFLSAIARIGFNTFDVHPEVPDTGISERVRRTNRAHLSAVVTFAYNATAEPGFNAVNGASTFYSDANISANGSQRLATGILNAIRQLGVSRALYTSSLDIGMLSSVGTVAALVEANFMTNYRWATLMNDPEWQTMVAESAARAVSNYFDVKYVPPGYRGCPVQRMGSRNACVRWLQWLLTVQGYTVGGQDGAFGTNTDAAVRAFQRDNYLTVDGIVGRNTWNLLDPDYAVAPLLKIGSRGVYVRYLQQKLLSKLYPIGTFSADGSFGNGTQQAVLAFQTEHNLPATGEVDAATWKAITVFNSPRPESR